MPSDRVPERMSETAGSVAYTFMKEMAARRSNDDLLNRSRRTLRGASHNGVCILVIACGLVGFLTSTAGAMVLDKGTVEKTLKSQDLLRGSWQIFSARIRIPTS